MAEDFITKNLTVLKKRYPLLPWHSAFASYQTPNAALMATKTELPTLLLAGKAVHSGYNPLAEATKICAPLHNTPSTEALLFLGMGLGYAVEEALKLLPTQKIFIAEANWSWFLFLLHQKDFTPLFSQPQVFLIDPSLSSDVLMEFWAELKVKKVKLLVNRTIFDYDSHNFTNLQTIVYNFNNRQLVNRATKAQYKQLWFRNFCKNLPFLAQLPGVNCFFNQFKALPHALLIGAGPSLTLAIPTLKKLQATTLLVCVDTAYRVLLKHGIAPHFVLCTDSQYWNSRHLDGCASKKTIFISDISLYPALLRQMNVAQQTYLCSAFLPPFFEFERQIEDKGLLKSGGSVATTALNFIEKLGITTIYLVAIDLAFPRGETHAKDCRFEEWALTDHQRLSPYNNTLLKMSHIAYPFATNANFGGKVLTDKRLDIYRSWFTEEAGHLTIFNTSCGATIENIAAKPLEALLTTSASSAPLNFQALLNDHSNIKRNENHLKAILKAQTTALLTAFTALEAALTTYRASPSASAQQKAETLATGNSFLHFFVEEPLAAFFSNPDHNPAILAELTTYIALLNQGASAL